MENIFGGKNLVEKIYTPKSKKKFPENFSKIWHYKKPYLLLLCKQNFFMSKLLTRVKKMKEKRNKVTYETFELPIWEFLMECYETCTPNKYGEVFTKKIIHDSNGKIKELSPKLDRGDLHMNLKKFFEGKISYKNINGKYSITNIRPWQELNYFILCFVDTEDNFKPHFYCVPKDAITNNPRVHLTGMNNQSKINQYNRYVGMRASISSDDIDWLFKKVSVLKGTNYKNLLSFIKNK